MHYVKTKIELPEDYPFQLVKLSGSENLDQRLHIHDNLELNYVLEGCGLNIIEDKKYDIAPGDIYIINNMEYHMAFYDSSLKMIIIHFDPSLIFQNNSFDYEYLRPFFNRDVSISNRITSDNPFYASLTSILMEIVREWEQNEEGYKLIIKSQLMKLLALLYRNFRIERMQLNDIKAYYKGYDRIRNVIIYINENYHSDIRYDDLARVAYMNKTYFSTFFKRVMKMTVSGYIENVRMNAACKLLLSTNMSITEISYQCGFSNLSHFCRVFKKHKNTSPNEFRTQK